MNRIALSIAGVDILVASPDVAFMRQARDRYAAFISKDSKAGWTCLVSVLRPSMPSSTSRPRISFMNGRNTLTIHSGNYDALADHRFRTAGVLVKGSIVSFDGFLRAFLSAVLAKRGAFLVHAAAVKIGGVAMVFPAGTSCGKSTLARKLGKGFAFGDELVAICTSGGKVTAHSTPFWGNFRKGTVNASAPLKAVCLLRRRGTTGLVPISKGECMRELMRRSLCYSDSPQFASALLSAVSSCCRNTRAYSFSFRLADKRDRVSECFKAGLRRTKP